MAQAQHANLPGPGASSMTDDTIHTCSYSCERPGCIRAQRDYLAARLAAETSNARGEVEYEYEVWQGDALQAGGSTTDYASAKSEADHYAMMYGQDGPVEVRIYEKRLLAAAPPPATAQQDGGEVVAYSEKFRASGDWSHYPIGTRAYDIQGGYWERVANGWKWCTGSTFPTPGGDAFYVSVPVRVPAPPSTPVGDGCHCGTCTCNPNMTPAVRFDLSPAQMEGAIRDHLIRLGWTPPEQQQEQAVASVACEGKPAPENNPCGWCGRTAPPSAPVGVEAELREMIGYLVSMAAQQYPDESKHYAERIDRVLAQQPAAVDGAK